MHASPNDVSYRGPDTKQLMSARLRRSTRRGLDAVVAKWRRRAAKVGDDAEAIDLTYAVDTLLAAACQSELKEYLDEAGELPTSESAWEAIQARIDKQYR